MCASDNPISTIPANILVTSAHSDMVLVGEDEVTLIALTIPHNSIHGEPFPSQKSQIGLPVSLGDLKVANLGFCLQPRLYTIEIGSLGHWLYTSQKALLKAVPLYKINDKNGL